MQTPYINACFLRGFSVLVLAKGGNPAALYKSVGLSKDLFIDNTNSMLIPFDKFVYLLEEAALQLDFPDVAMQLARQQDVMILAPLGPMLSRCNHAAEALETIIKYLKILVSGYQVDIQVQHDCATITFNMALPHIQELTQYQDYAMASAVSVFHSMLGKSYPIRACYFLRSEQNQHRVADYARYYGCPVAFNCRTLSLTVDRSMLDLDVKNQIKQINTRVSHALSSNQEGIEEQVAKVISFSLANGSSNIVDIAASMNYSQRTLQRKLNEQNTSYSALLDSVRFSMANQYLKNTYYRLTDIAVLLGYSNLSSFSRSYHRWCGVYPMEVRKQLKK